jgi:DNA-binding response OmpR family regulator
MRDNRCFGRILVVEDEVLIGEDVSNTLKSHGYEVIGIANSAQQAVRMAIANEPDLVLMDVRIRGDLDGFEAHRLVEDAIGKPVPVIFLTASDTNNAIFLRSKVLRKPYLEGDLLGSIEDFLSLMKGRPN